ncbi:hypothetical protein HaLaN_19391 [Haematococcus lacustris]|uniref:Uncharacterized protein n=1 Tax=Haematococcus lacustris TaxID=44745 RepID=A0A699ZTA2_HAELA|nr:hypothetical protein HaLaN_19391 [Haematococcus lacustris]
MDQCASTVSSQHTFPLVSTPTGTLHSSRGDLHALQAAALACAHAMDVVKLCAMHLCIDDVLSTVPLRPSSHLGVMSVLEDCWVGGGIETRDAAM